MKPAKYPQNCRTKRQWIYRVKTADANELFFSRDTNRFFGLQTFDVSDDGLELYITFKKHPRATVYTIDPVTCKLGRKAQP